MLPWCWEIPFPPQTQHDDSPRYRTKNSQTYFVHRHGRRPPQPTGWPNPVGRRKVTFQRGTVTAGVLLLRILAMTIIALNLLPSAAAAALSGDEPVDLLLQHRNSIFLHDRIQGNETATANSDDTVVYPCTIDRMSAAEFWNKFPHGLPPLYPRPIVIVSTKDDDDHRDDDDDRHRHDNRAFRHMTTPGGLVDFFGNDFNVTLTSSNALSEHSRVVPLVQYLREIWRESQVPVDRPSNETWYLFGNTHSDRWKALLRHYRTPPYCAVCRHDFYGDNNDDDDGGDDEHRPMDSSSSSSSLLAHSFGIGHRGSGVQWHVHGPGVAETLHGRKHWLLYPKGHGPIEGYHKDQSSWQWFHKYYPIVAAKPLECTIGPGEVLYFPDRWWHATINWNPYTAFVSTFASEHEYVATGMMWSPGSPYRHDHNEEL